VVAGELVGLQLGASLKGLNFRDDESGNFDKNLTGRLYELADEMTTVHRHLPHAFMAGIFFMPIDSCFDKGQSSFAHTVFELRRRTDRDPASSAHNAKCDLAAVGLYSAGGGSETAQRIERGAVRFFPVDHAPPRHGLPKVESTLDLEGLLVERMLGSSIAGTAASDEYGDADDGLVADELTPLDDVVVAEEAGEVDELSLEE